MDPLSALSVAGNIIQFIQFGSQILSKGQEIYKSPKGQLAEVDEIEAVSNDVKDISENVKLSLTGQQLALLDGSNDKEIDIASADRDLEDLTSSLRRSLDGRQSFYGDEHDQALNTICDRCIAIADELSRRFYKLKVKGQKHRRWKSFRQALKTVWRKEDIDKIAKRLSMFRGQLELRILASLRTQQNKSSILEDSRFQALQAGTQDVITFIIENRSLFLNEIQLRSEKLEHSAHSQHERTRATVVEAVHGIRDVILKQESSQFTLLDSLLKLKEKVRTVEEINHDVEILLLEALRFATMAERHEDIAEAHRRTFDWILDENKSEDKPWTNFAEWLRSGSGVYWVNGKAASGKSTLMRHVYDNTETRTILLEWAQTLDLKIHGFFFWNSGTKEQRSHEGILRSLLYQSLHAQPELIKTLLHSKSDIIWSLPTLQQSFKRLTSELLTSKLCIFIDGLDEYDGDHGEMAVFLKEIAALPTIKVCVSSRPWMVFEDVFKGLPTLRLHDLTYTDIVYYVDDRLNSNERWVQLEKIDLKNAQALKKELVTMANGIFLWVKLVVTSLLSGLSNHDEISDLSRRLSLLPRGLAKLYNHMLNAIDPPFYLEEASRFFQILRTTREAQDQATIEVPEVAGMLNLLTLSLADKKYSRIVFAPFNPTNEEVLIDCQRTADRLKTRCAGLLELGGLTEEGYSLQNVVYLHRTVRDFLERPDVWSMVLSNTSDSEFHPSTCLLQSCILYLKIQLGRDCSMPSRQVWRVIQLAMIYARMVEDHTGSRQEQLLDELDMIISAHQREYDPSFFHWSTERNLQGRELDYESFSSFLAFAIEYGVSYYVRSKVYQDPTVIRQRQGRPLLDYAVCPNRLISNIPNRPKIVALLLDYGASPNEVYKGNTPWKTALFHLSKYHWQSITHTSDETSLALSDWIEVITLLITHGADPNVSCSWEGKSRPKLSAIKIVRDAFTQPFPAQAANIKRMLIARGARDDAPTPSQVMLSRYAKLPEDPELQPLISNSRHLIQLGNQIKNSDQKSGLLEWLLCCSRRRNA